MALLKKQEGNKR